jgi:hypothetical protein
MTLLAAPLAALAASFAAMDPDADLRARQRAAQVRVSLLTREWGWLDEASVEDRLLVFLGLLRWARQKEDREIYILFVFTHVVVGFIGAELEALAIAIHEELLAWTLASKSLEELSSRLRYLYRLGTCAEEALGQNPLDVLHAHTWRRWGEPKGTIVEEALDVTFLLSWDIEAGKVIVDPTWVNTRSGGPEILTFDELAEEMSRES